MPSIENYTPLRLSLAAIKETGFSIKPDLKDSEVDNVEWLIGFRPFLPNVDNHISIEVRSTAVLPSIGSEVAACSVMLTFVVENLSAFATKESDTKVNVKDQLMLNMLNPAYGTLRGVMATRFLGTVLEKKPLPLIDILSLLKSAKKVEAAK